MGRPSKIDDPLAQKIFHMYVMEHKSMYQISKETGAHPQSIKRLLLRHGYIVRDLSDAMSNYHENKKRKK